jgi:hypothetical protein
VTNSQIPPTIQIRDFDIFPVVHGLIMSKIRPIELGDLINFFILLFLVVSIARLNSRGVQHWHLFSQAYLIVCIH